MNWIKQPGKKPNVKELPNTNDNLLICSSCESLEGPRLCIELLNVNTYFCKSCWDSVMDQVYTLSK